MFLVNFIIIIIIIFVIVVFIIFIIYIILLLVIIIIIIIISCDEVARASKVNPAPSNYIHYLSGISPCIQHITSM